MTNEQIILKAREALVQAGTIGANETIHTFEAWHKLGYSVKRGEKAVTRLVIWKNSSKQKTVEIPTEDGETVKKDIKVGNFFRKESCFFSSSQVEKSSKRSA